MQLIFFLGGGVDATQATVTAGRKISLGLKYKVPRRLEARGCRKWEDWLETSNSSSNNHWLTKECSIICITELTTQPTLKQCVNRIHTHWTLLLDLQPSIQFLPELLHLMRRDKDGQMEKGWGPLAASRGTQPTCSGTLWRVSERHSSVLPVVLSGKRTSVDTGSSRRSCLPGRGRQRCAAGACWPAQTLEGRRR